MSLALYASPYDNNSNSIDHSTDNLISKKRLAHHNKTQKYYNRDNNTSNQSDKVKNIIKKIHDNSMYNDSIDGVEMGDFSPISPPESAGVNRTIDKSNFKENYTGIGIEDDNDIDNYTYNNNRNNNNNNNNSVDALSSSNNSNYYTIPSDNNSKSSMQQQEPPLQRQLSSQSNQQNKATHPNASNYLDSIEYNNLNNNYGDSKTIEEYYKKFSPNYSYGTVSNWNRNAQTQSQSNMNNKKIYANGNLDNSSSPFLPSLISSSHTNNENSILIEKLNYMIHLLEEQQDERTNNVTEEVILYCFLGVFMIFIVDSFTRVGKYVR